MFNKDLDFGEKIEKELLKLLLDKGYIEVFKIKGYFKYFDLIAVKENGEITTIEVKADRQYKETGNVAFEVFYKGSLSGVFASTADIVIYYLDQFYYIKTADLKTHLLTSEIIKVRGGDNNHSELYLITLDDFKQIFTSLG